MYLLVNLTSLELKFYRFVYFFVTSIVNHWFFMSTTSSYKENTFLPQLLLISPSNWLICSSCILSASHPYLQPEGWIAKGAAQRDRPNARERRFWLPPNDHQWSRSTAAKPNVFDFCKGQTTTPGTSCPALHEYSNIVSVGSLTSHFYLQQGLWDGTSSLVLIREDLKV